jgi:hypothetical protein
VRTPVRRLQSILRLSVVVAVLSGCSEFETKYFKDRVGEVSQEIVARRYGAPHRAEQLTDGRSVWTYFDRGSGTSGYAGTARSSYCRAYLLTFDQQNVLREWRQQDCSGRPD